MSHGYTSRVVRALALALPLGCALVGCSGGPDEYPTDLRYTLRTDPLVIGTPSALPTRPDSPGHLDKHIAGIAKLEGAKLLDPARIERPDARDLRQALYDFFGTPARPNVLAESPEAEKAVRDLKLDRGTLTRGSGLYRRHCMHCHGVNGDGRGPTGPWVHPHPRDYRRGVFKFVSTGNDVYKATRKPRRADIVRVINQGIDGTSMPAFGLLPDAEIEALASYVIHLSLRGEVEFSTMQTLLTGGKDALEPQGDIPEHVATLTDQILKRWADASAAEAMPAPAYPYTDDKRSGAPPAESIRRGYEIFTDSRGAASCIACHADFGRQVPFRYDDWGTLVRPANLTAGTYRGGRRPIDIYWRITHGIGSAMPAADLTKKTDEETARAYWDLVNFVQALPYPQMLPRDVRDKVYPARKESADTRHAAR